MIRSSLLEKHSDIQHGFATKGEPVDFEARVSEVEIHQVHGADVAIDRETDSRRLELGDHDGVVSNCKGHRLVVQSADCVPVLMFDPRTRSVAALHCGWRSTQKNIVPKALALLTSRYKVVASDLLVAIGPSICQDCFEVGQDVIDAFHKLLEAHPNSDGIARKTGEKYHFDLKSAIRFQLQQHDVREIDDLELCTFCDTRFSSFRRDGKRYGNQFSAIQLT